LFKLRVNAPEQAVAATSAQPCELRHRLDQFSHVSATSSRERVLFVEHVVRQVPLAEVCYHEDDAMARPELRREIPCREGGGSRGNAAEDPLLARKTANRLDSIVVGHGHYVIDHRWVVGIRRVASGPVVHETLNA